MSLIMNENELQKEAINATKRQSIKSAFNSEFDSTQVDDEDDISNINEKPQRRR
jgi:hypothetical protein